MPGHSPSLVSSVLDGITAAAVRSPRSAVLVDGRPWDGRPFGDVAFVMTSNKNVVRQHRPVARACIAAGLQVVFVYVDVSDTWNPSLDDYSIDGAHIVQLPLRTSWLGVPFPNSVALLAMFAELKDLFPQQPFKTLVTHIDDYGLCRLLCYWAKRTGVPSVVLQEGMTLIHGADDARSVAGPRSAIRAVASRLFRGVPHDLFELRILYSYADFFCAYGAAAKRELIGHGRTPDSVIVAGNPSFDHLTQPPRRRPVPEQPCTIMFVQQDVVEKNAAVAFFDNLARICCDESGYRLIIKFHPLSELSADTVAELLPKTAKRASLLEIRATGDAADMMDEADVMMTIHSTTAYHALVKGIPVVTVNYLAEGFGEFDAYRYGGALDVRKDEDLAQAIRDATTNEEVRQKLHDGAQRVIEDHLYKLDGQASLRIAQVIADIATGALPCTRSLS